MVHVYMQYFAWKNYSDAGTIQMLLLLPVNATKYIKTHWIQRITAMTEKLMISA